MVINMSEYNNVPKIRFKGFTDVWEQRKLKELGDILTGSTPSTQHEEYYSQNGMLWVTPTDIDSNIIKNTAKKLSDEGVKVARIVPANTILVTCIASIGKNALILEKSSFNQQINSLTPYKEYNPYFLLTESSVWSKKMKQQGASGMMQMVNKNEFSELETFVPKTKEQNKIGDLFTNLDNLITLHQRKCDTLVNVKKSLLEKMFPKNSSNIPEIRFKGFTDVWEQRKFGDYGTVSMCKRIFKNETSDSGDIPFYKIGTFGGKADAFISNEKYDYYKSKFSYPNKGDILLSASGTIGRIVEYTGEKAYFQDSNIVWLNHNEDIKNVFLKVLYPTVKWDGIEGSTIKRLYNSNFLNTCINIPNTLEQNKIGELFTNLDNLITLHQRKLEKLNNIKKSMLDKMFV